MIDGYISVFRAPRIRHRESQSSADLPCPLPRPPPTDFTNCTFIQISVPRVPIAHFFQYGYSVQSELWINDPIFGGFCTASVHFPPHAQIA